jgi:hypothetical protein
MTVKPRKPAKRSKPTDIELLRKEVKRPGKGLKLPRTTVQVRRGFSRS